MRIGIAADHGGYALKEEIVPKLKAAGHEIKDFGAVCYDDNDDYPDLIIPMAKAMAAGEVDRGIAFCGSGVGACVAANKVAGVRAATITDVFSAHQGVEDDDVNVICLGGRVIGGALAWELAQTFLKAKFTKADRHQRRLTKVIKQESAPTPAVKKQIAQNVCADLRKQGIAEDIVKRVEKQILYGSGD